MAYGKSKLISTKPSRPAGAYPRTITFSGPKSKRLAKAQPKRGRM